MGTGGDRSIHGVRGRRWLVIYEGHAQRGGTVHALAYLGIRTGLDYLIATALRWSFCNVWFCSTSASSWSEVSKRIVSIAVKHCIILYTTQHCAGIRQLSRLTSKRCLVLPPRSSTSFRLIEMNRRPGVFYHRRNQLASCTRPASPSSAATSKAISLSSTRARPCFPRQTCPGLSAISR